jgi:hypothetical protein
MQYLVFDPCVLHNMMCKCCAYVDILLGCQAICTFYGEYPQCICIHKWCDVYSSLWEPKSKAPPKNY